MAGGVGQMVGGPYKSGAFDAIGGMFKQPSAAPVQPYSPGTNQPYMYDGLSPGVGGFDMPMVA